MATQPTKTTENIIDEKEELLKKIAELEAKLAEKSNSASVAPTVSFTMPSTDVRLKYMADSLGVIQITNLELNCTRYGEEFTLSRQQFDEVVGKYRSWFDSGILAVAPRDIEVAASKGVRTSDEYTLSADTLNRLGSMSVAEIERLWNSVTTDSHKLSIVSFFKRKFMEGKEPGYRDQAKVDLLNRLTKGGLKREAVEISGQDLKIRPTNFNDVDIGFKGF